MRNKLAFLWWGGVYASFLMCRSRYQINLLYFSSLQGLCEIFSYEIPLFLFSGVFLKLFLYRSLIAIKKQVTLDFRYLITYFFRIDPTPRNKQVIPSKLLFTPSHSHVLIELSFIKRRLYYALRKNSTRTNEDSVAVGRHSDRP